MFEVLNCGRGVLLQRGIAFDLEATLEYLDHPRFAQCLLRWMRSGENFLLYAIAGSGLHFAYETSRRSVILERFDLVLSMFEARLKKVEFQIQTDAAMRDVSAAKACAHLGKLFPSDSLDDGVKIYSGNHPLFGYIRAVSVPRDVVLKMDVASLLHVFDSSSCSLDELQSNWMQLRFAFEGWDDDPREIFEIPEIRKFLKAVVTAAPWWVGLVHPANYMILFAAIESIEHCNVNTDMKLTMRFAPNVLENACAIAAVGAAQFLACSEIESWEAVESMFSDLNISLGLLQSGVNLAKADPLTVTSLRG